MYKVSRNFDPSRLPCEGFTIWSRAQQETEEDGERLILNIQQLFEM